MALLEQAVAVPSLAGRRQTGRPDSWSGGAKEAAEAVGTGEFSSASMVDREGAVVPGALGWSWPRASGPLLTALPPVGHSSTGLAGYIQLAATQLRYRPWYRAERSSSPFTASIVCRKAWQVSTSPLAASP